MKITVFCGASADAPPALLQVATDLGRRFAGEGIELIYGGSSMGMMGCIADAVLAGGGSVVGVMPQFLLDREAAHRGLSKLHTVGSLHERKVLMIELADAFITLPGGLGTLDEFFEVCTQAQLRLHAKPNVILNTDGYFDLLLGFLDRAVASGLLASRHRGFISVADSAEQAIALTKKSHLRLA